MNGSAPYQIVIRHHSWPIALTRPKADTVVQDDSDPDNIYDSDDEEDRFDDLQAPITRECPISDKGRKDDPESEEIPIDLDDTPGTSSTPGFDDTFQTKLFKALDDERNQVGFNFHDVCVD